MDHQKIKITCPTCCKQTEWHPDNPFRPFCSERCKLIDLGAWADEAFAIEAEEDFQDLSPNF